MKDQTIHLEGHVIGYQFNKQSMGSRLFRHRTVQTEDGQTGTVYFRFLGRDVVVERIATSHVWYAVE